MGKSSALWFCIVPPFGRANTATLELKIFPYCPTQGSAIIIELVDSISRDGPDTPILYIVHYKKRNNSEQVKL